LTLDDGLKGLRAGTKPRDRVFAGRVRRRTFLGGLESSLKFRGGEGAVLLPGSQATHRKFLPVHVSRFSICDEMGDGGGVSFGGWWK